MKTPASRWRRAGTVALVVLAVIVATLGTLAVIAAGFALSFDAIRTVGTAAGIRPGIAWMLPVSIDGAMLVATITAIILRTAGRVAWYPWVVVVVGVAISIACNATHAGLAGGVLTLTPGTARAVSAIPAVTLFLSVHLLITLALAVIQQPANADTAPDTIPDTPPPADTPDESINADDTAPETPDESAGGAPSDVRLASDQARLITRALRTAHPDMDLDIIAATVGRSTRQVKRYLDPDTAPTAQ